MSDELGRALTVAQQNQVDGLLESVEDWIDSFAKDAPWLVTSPVTAETHPVVGGLVYLDRTPVATVTAVTVRSRSIGATATTLVAGTSYELLDLARGIVSVGDYGDDVLVSVSYTHISPRPVPPRVRLLATKLVAHELRDRLDPAMAAVESISVGQGDLSLKYRAGSSDDGGLPDDVQWLIRSIRGLVLA